MKKKKKTFEEEVKEKLDRLKRIESDLSSWFIRLNTGRKVFESFEIQDEIDYLRRSE